MKEVILAILSLMLCAILNAQEADKEAIKTVIQEAYIDGLQNKGDLDKTRQGFHPGFNLLMLGDDGIMNKLPIYNWIQISEIRKAKDPSPVPESQLVTCEYDMIDITGKAAIAKISLYKEGKKIFTDYLSLYQFPDGWKIVGKIYHRYPAEQ
ncbi:MAG: nuclear transport factor 2 family protein [Bacteroidetes bacterium]|nr:nuclear transport factor 2 family protein [Bacteroidota bacterium]